MRTAHLCGDAPSSRWQTVVLANHRKRLMKSVQRYHQPPDRRRFRRLCARQVRGVSLVELVCIIVIVGVLAAIAAPRFGSSLAQQRVEAAARRLIVDLTLARQRAMSTNASQTMQIDSSADTYALVGMPHPDHSSRDYGVSLGEEPYLATVVSANFGGDQEIIFDVFGLPDSGGSVVISVGSHVETIEVDADTGKARVQ